VGASEVYAPLSSQSPVALYGSALRTRVEVDRRRQGADWHAVMAVDKDQPCFTSKPLKQVVSIRFCRQAISDGLLALFASVALMLAARRIMGDVVFGETAQRMRSVSGWP